MLPLVLQTFSGEMRMTMPPAILEGRAFLWHREASPSAAAAASLRCLCRAGEPAPSGIQGHFPQGQPLTSRKGTTKLAGAPGKGGVAATCSRKMPFPCSKTSGWPRSSREPGKALWVMV